jgi:hypothetical protein
MPMDRFRRWKLADELNAYQIALLIAGYDPSTLEEYTHGAWPDEVKEGTAAYLNAIKNAARSDKFTVKVARDKGENGEIDWYSSTIDIESFCEWLRSRNFKDGFFIETQEGADAISDTSSKYYAPKLAAAVRACWRFGFESTLTNMV